MSLEDIQRKAAEAARNAQANLNSDESVVNSQIAEVQILFRLGVKILQEWRFNMTTIHFT